MTEEKTKPDDEIEFIRETGPPKGGSPAPPPAEPAEAKKEAAEKDAGAEGARPLKDKLKRKDAEIKHLKKELEEAKDNLLRKLAETENLRKRYEREKADYFQYALSGLLLELVGITDNFERALQALPADADADGKTFRDGVELIFRMFQNVLAKNGVRPIVLKDRAFDPNFHHAMTVTESEDVREPEVEEELQKGYLLHDRLLRPTLVKVVVPKKGQ
jgi:molecular chaperone GrpE